MQRKTEIVAKVISATKVFPPKNRMCVSTSVVSKAVSPFVRNARSVMNQSIERTMIEAIHWTVKNATRIHFLRWKSRPGERGSLSVYGLEVFSRDLSPKLTCCMNENYAMNTLAARKSVEVCRPMRIKVNIMRPDYSPHINASSIKALRFEELIAAAGSDIVLCEKDLFLHVSAVG